MAPTALQTLRFRILTYICIFILQNENGIVCKVSCAQGVNFGFVSISGVSKLMGKEIKDSKDHLKQKEKAFVAKDCFALGV